MMTPLITSAVEKDTLYTICQAKSVITLGVIVRRRMEMIQVLHTVPRQHGPLDDNSHQKTSEPCKCTYKKPRPKTPVNANFWVPGSLRRQMTGSGSKRMIKSVTMFATLFMRRVLLMV